MIENNNFEKITSDEEMDPFLNLINKAGLLAAGTPGHVNMMTVSSGVIGNMFRRNTVWAFIRPGRYTKELIDSGEYFSFNFFKDEYKDTVMKCASCSGRDTDKVAFTGLTPEFAECGAPYFAEADIVYVCRKVYTDVIKPECFNDPDIEKWYPKKDYHYIYVGEIVEVLKKTE